MMARVIKIPRMIASYERSSVILVAHVRATIPWRKFLAFEEQLALLLKRNDLTSPNLSRRTRSTGCSLSGLGGAHHRVKFYSGGAVTVAANTAPATMSIAVSTAETRAGRTLRALQAAETALEKIVSLCKLTP